VLTLGQLVSTFMLVTSSTPKQRQRFHGARGYRRQRCSNFVILAEIFGMFGIGNQVASLRLTDWLRTVRRFVKLWCTWFLDKQTLEKGGFSVCQPMEMLVIERKHMSEFLTVTSCPSSELEMIMLTTPHDYQLSWAPGLMKAFLLHYYTAHFS
jgi:hypothetical protein